MFMNRWRHAYARVLLSLVPLAAVRPTAAGGQKPAPTDDVKITLAGDSIVNRRLSVFDDPASKGLFDFIRQSDAGFTNFETLITNYAYQAPQSAAALISPRHHGSHLS